jgi:hypothetical protein
LLDEAGDRQLAVLPHALCILASFATFGFFQWFLRRPLRGVAKDAKPADSFLPDLNSKWIGKLTSATALSAHILAGRRIRRITPMPR